MLSIVELNKLAHDQRERMWNYIRAGVGDTPEFFADPEEAHIAAIIVNYTANQHNMKTKTKKPKK